MEELAEKPVALQVVQQVCLQEAGQVERAASHTWARAWKDWASTTATADGARLAHRWIMQVAPWADASVDANGLAVQPQEQADLVAEEWHDLWKVGRACETDFGGVNSGPVVPSPSPDDLRDVCGSFSAHTATGSNNSHPALRLKRAANIGYCTAVFATIIMMLSPNATGGKRPTGLFTIVLRVYLRWTRRRARFLQALLVRADCAPCQPATWRPSMAGEIATSVGFSAASALIDLAKAFEHIQYTYLWRMG